MARWREQGRSYRWIGARLGYSPGLIRWNCLKVGADTPKGPQIAASKMPMLTIRNGREVRRFTAEEDARLVRMDMEGATYSAIAKAMGRTRNSVTGRLMTLAMWDARREIAVVS